MAAGVTDRRLHQHQHQRFALMPGDPTVHSDKVLDALASLKQTVDKVVDPGIETPVPEVRLLGSTGNCFR